MKKNKEISEIHDLTKLTHGVWHKFSNWLIKTYGQDLHGEWLYLDNINKKYKYRLFDDAKLAKRLVGYDVMSRVESYCKRYCPEIKILSCDDSVHASSTLLLIPHPTMGITVIFIPQCTGIQNQFFLYKRHCENLIDALTEMKQVYEKQIK
jgi:hypothetical protein